MKKELIRKFVEKLDYSYNYKTVNERQNIINELCEIAGIEQLTIPVVVEQSEQFSLADMKKAYEAGENNAGSYTYPPFEEWFSKR
jgi:hypothetical protein